MPLNIPNQITLARLLLACVFFVILAVAPPAHALAAQTYLIAAFWVFLVAVVSDVIDGHLARMLKQVSTFGRIVDPVVDKVLVCGAFAFLAGAKFHSPDGASLSDVAPWLVVLILGRELLISAFRAQSEATGRDFSATWSGKIKMIVQSTTVCVILGRLAFFPTSAAWRQIAIVLVWLTVIVTLWSLYTYVRRALRTTPIADRPPTHASSEPDDQEHRTISSPSRAADDKQSAPSRAVSGATA
ncbi:MAG: CDP-diacylglycerol--glycerol-3-phosphate 3-phosphatidyltransferase [Phycisphaerales bacterium]|nr:CDP-diacylglycerol--glycerol-3-phosphate 3-phosphatidyltransferase [Phycisphaerales bacterium]